MDGSSYMRTSPTSSGRAAKNDSFCATSFYVPWPFSKFAIPLVKAMHIFGGGGKENDLLIMLQHLLLSFKKYDFEN